MHRNLNQLQHFQRIVATNNTTLIFLNQKSLARAARKMLRLATRRGTTIISAYPPLFLSPISCLPITQQRRTFFGLGEIVGVLANPAETIRQLKESKELLTKAREETELRNEKKKIPKKHTFSKLPGFHGRETEQGKVFL